jgi:hypothetical protein
MSNYDELLPVSLHQTNDGEYLLLDRHNDELATFQPLLEVEEMKRLVALINESVLLTWVEQNRASLWPADKEGTRYTLFARQAGELPIQPTRATLSETIVAAIQQQQKRKAEDGRPRAEGTDS